VVTIADMNDPRTDDPEQERIADQAAAWVLRKDRGLTAVEQDEFSDWIAADPRHGPALARSRRHWKRIDLLAQWRPEHSPEPNPDLLAPPLRRRFRRYLPISLACAAAIVLSVGWFARSLLIPSRAVTAVVATAPPGGQRVLEDGSIVELNRDSEIAVSFSPAERRVRLVRGEGHFVVAKDNSRPFVVNASGVDVRAVGTVFNVRVGTEALEVLVTEGHVQVGPNRQTTNEPAVPPRNVGESRLAPRQRAFFPLSPTAGSPQIATLTLGEIERVLAWQHVQLDFTAAPLREIVTEFNHRNVIQLVVADPELASVRITATFRSDNLMGFVQLLEAGFGARAERRTEEEIVLRKVR